MSKKVTTDSFIEKANIKHNFKFDYSELYYINNKSKVIIICPIHGRFEQLPYNHIKGSDCYKCGLIKQARFLSNKTKSQRNWNFQQPLDYKLIPLTKGKFTKVDNDDFNILKNINWSISSVLNYAYNKELGYMHTYIIKVSDMLVDHINNDGLDNRKFNLRTCTHSQNSMNQSIRVNIKTSVYKGVSFRKINNKWMARITANGVLKNLGCFTNEHDAALAYNTAALEYHKEFANLNIINKKK